MSRNRKTRKKVKKKSKIKMNEVVLFPNKDKLLNENWGDYKRQFFDIPAPYTLCIVGGKNMGKSTIIKNILLFTSLGKRPFEECFLCHPDPESEEYDDVHFKKTFTHIPPLDVFNRKRKSLLIIDDIDVSRMNKRDAGNLNRLWGYICSHKHVTCILSTQCMKNIEDPTIRRMTDVMAIGNIEDPDEIRIIARNLGRSITKIERLIQKHLKGRTHNCLFFDKLPKCPFPIRAIKGRKFVIIEKRKKKEDK